MPRSTLKKTRCPYCKKAHRCHNKCASKRVSARITREGKPRAARAVGRAIARGCSPRRGQRTTARSPKGSLALTPARKKRAASKGGYLTGGGKEFYNLNVNGWQGKVTRRPLKSAQWRTVSRAQYERALSW